LRKDRGSTPEDKEGQEYFFHCVKVLMVLSDGIRVQDMSKNSPGELSTDFYSAKWIVVSAKLTFHLIR
jgi:hypothetical protein